MFLISSIMSPMTSFFLNTSFTKNVLSNLINRQFRDYFNSCVDSKDLHFDLNSGTASVKRLDLNVAHINEVLAEHGLVHVCEGFIEEVTLKLSNVLTDGIEICINGLQVTLNPIRPMHDSDTRQLVESVTKTLAEGIILDKESTAEECLGADQTDNPAAGQFASVIDQLLSKVRIVFKDAEIRIESDKSTMNGPQVGLEIRIEHMEFLDDNSAPLKKPNDVLQKVLNITNVRLYTDIFSPMHSSTSTASSGDGEKLPSNIVQFAHLSGKHTVKIAVENVRLPGVNGIMSKKTQIDLDSEGSIFFMLTPSQIVLLKSLLAQIGPKTKNPDSIPQTPMEEAVNSMFTSVTAKQQPKTSNRLQSMSSSYLPTGPTVNLLDLSLDEISFSQNNRNAATAPSASGDVDDDEFCNIQMSEISDAISFLLHASSIYGIITHEDPLGKAYIEKTYEDGSNVQDVIEIMRTDADIFFTIIPTMDMSSNNKLQQQKHIFDKAFNGDHLRFTIQDAVIQHKFETDGYNSHVSASSIFKKIQLRESLTKDSIFGANQGDVVSILNFNDESGLQMSLKSSWRCGFAREHFVDISVPDLKLIIDPSIIDRLSKLIVTEPYFQFSESESKHRHDTSENLDNASKLKVRLACPKMEVNLLIPDSSNTKIPYTVSDLHSEYLKLDFVNLLLTTSPSEIDTFTTFRKFDLCCNSIIGTFMGLRKDTWKPFLFAQQPKDIPLVTVSYDFRNKSLMNSDSKKCSIFTNKKVFLDSVRLIMPASPDELKTFSHTCKVNSDINVEVNLVSANLNFFDKAFFESIYKRFNDLCSFQLRASAFVSNVKEEVSLEGLISTESSFSNDNDDCPLNFDSENETAKTTRKSNKLSLSVSLGTAKVMLSTSGGEADSFVKSQTGLKLDGIKVFLVNGYRCHAGAVNCFIGAERNTVVHRNLITYVEPFQADVTDKEFMQIRPSDVIAEQKADYGRAKHAVAIAIKVKPFIDLLTSREQKTVTFALAAKDTMIHFRPFTDLSRFWVTQLVNFFDIFNNGPSNPDIIVKPNIHLSKFVIDYDHKLAVPGSPMSLKINIGRCDLVKLDPPRLYFQDTTMSIRKADNRNADFLKVLGVEMLVLEVNNAIDQASTKKKNASMKKSTEIVIQDASLKAWMCSDTISELMNLVTEFMASEYGSAFGNNAADATVQTLSRPVANSTAPCVEPIKKSKSVDLCDVVQVSLDGEDGEPTEFVETFDPKVRYIDDIQIDPNFIKASSPGKNPDAELPDDHPQATFKLVIKNASLTACLYGGNDFGTDYNPKVFSRFNERADLRACRQGGIKGGPYRDHTVWVEMKATKIDFEHSSFDKTGNLSSFQVLKVGNVEVFDHLMISDAEKLLKKHDSQRYIYPKPVLLLRHAINQNNEGKLHLRLEPLKLNIDQDTMEFLSDFISSAGHVLTETVEIDENFDDIASTSAGPCETKYIEFNFFPSCKINFDYTGKRIDLQHQQGMVSGLASGILQLTGTELTLKELDSQGIYGFSNCIAYAIEQWSADVITQLPSNLVTLAPVAPISNVVSSVIYHSSSVVYPSVRMLLAPWRYYQQTDQE